MNETDSDKVERILKRMGHEKAIILEFIDKLKRLLAIAEASAPANVARERPLKPGSSTAIHLETIIKATEKYLKAISAIETDQELKTRLKLHPKLNVFESAELLLKNAKEVKDYQSATGKSKRLHLLPELKGKNVQSYETLMKVNALASLLSQYGFGIQPKKDSHPTDPFSRLTSIILKKDDPRRAINAYLNSSICDS